MKQGAIWLMPLKLFPLCHFKTEVDGAHERSAHRPGTWNGKGRTQPLGVYQRINGQESPWKCEVEHVSDEV